ncbi:hypothetical protein ACVMAJ_005567 [Bradyrhizobium sp. USDA 4448]
MRAFAASFLALASLVQAHAQGTAEKPKRADSGLNNICVYTIRGYPREVPAGVNICWRVAYPYLSQYALLHCDPKNNFQEITTVRHGDPRCERYEDRQ